MDRVGKLQDDTMLAILGLIPGEKLAETLIKDLGVDDRQAQLIVHDINEEIFGEIRKKIREKLEEEKIEDSQPIKGEIIKSDVEEKLDRDELLRGIEDPDPIISGGSKYVVENIEEIKTQNVNTPPTTITPATQTPPVSVTVEQKTSIQPPKIIESPKNENFSPPIKKIDPYREPI